MDYKKIVTRITIVFVGVMLFLTFFSRTLSDMYIPRVTLEFAGAGVIAPEARSFGVVQSLSNNIFYMEVSLPIMLGFIGINQSAEIVAGSERVTGITTGVASQGGRNIVTIEFQSDTLSGGEFASVVISGGSIRRENIIPLSALRQDQHGYFILYVEAVPRRFFGSSYYVRTARVDAGLRDTANAAISSMWGAPLPEEPIVINSDLPVHPGTRVRIVGRGDFQPTR